MFKFGLSKQVKTFLEKLGKKDKILARAINRKIKEIISRDNDTIDYYKNLSKGLKAFKRVHITNWLVLIFEVDLKKNFIVFHKIGHRDEIYKALV